MMNFKRFLYLIKNDLFMQSKTLLMGALGLVLFFTVFDAYDALGTYRLFLFSYGLFITGYAFSDMHDKTAGYRYLLLPASHAEKFFSRYLLSSIFYMLSFTLVLSGAAWCYGALIQGFPPEIRLFSKGVWQANLSYLMLQPIALLGAVYFKNRVLLKTGLAVLVILSIACALLVLGLYVFYVDFFELTYKASNFLIGMLAGSEYFFKFAFAPLCIFIAYVRFKECEI